MFFQNFSQIKSAFFTLPYLNRSEAANSSLNKQERGNQTFRINAKWSLSDITRSTHSSQ